jgi:hypothetical protein
MRLPDVHLGREDATVGAVRGRHNHTTRALDEPRLFGGNESSDFEDRLLRLPRFDRPRPAKALHVGDDDRRVDAAFFDSALPPNDRFPMVSQASNTGAGSPARPASATRQHPGVAMARNASQQAPGSRNHTPQMVNTPSMAQAMPGRQLSQTPRLQSGSPDIGMSQTPNGVMMQSGGQMNQNLTPAQIAMLTTQRELNAGQGMPNRQMAARNPVASMTPNHKLFAQPMAKMQQAFQHCQRLWHEQSLVGNIENAAKMKEQALNLQRKMHQMKAQMAQRQQMAGNASSPGVNMQQQTPQTGHAHPGHQQQNQQQMQQMQQMQAMQAMQQQQQQQQQPQSQPQPQQTIGSRMSMFGDSRPESRPGLPASTSFRQAELQMQQQQGNMQSTNGIPARQQQQSQPHHQGELQRMHMPQPPHIETDGPRSRFSGPVERLWVVCQTVSRDETAAEDVRNTSAVKSAMEPHMRNTQVSRN